MRFRAAAANICVALISGALALFACEFAVRTLAPQNLSGSWFVEAATGPYMVNKSVGTARHQFGQRIVHYAFTAPHLRAPAGTGRHKILVLGDSFTFGLLLANKDTYVSRLQDHADQALGAGAIGFLNGGIGGSGTADHLAFYEDFGPSTGAQTILIFLNVDDIGRSLRSRVYRWDEGPQALVRNDNIAGNWSIKSLLNSLPFYNAALEHSHLIQLARIAMLARPVRRTDIVETPVPLSPAADHEKAQLMGAALFTRLADRARERGHRLIVATTGWHRFKSNDPSEPTTAFMAAAPELFARLGVPFFDISARLHSHVAGDISRISIPRDGHPNEAGAKLIGDFVWEAIAPHLRWIASGRRPQGASATAEKKP